MKTLYFDFDGTVVFDSGSTAKSELGGGGLEVAVQRAEFQRLVCVGNFVAIANTVREVMPEYDAIGALFALCRGAFEDESWLRSHTVLVEDPKNRAEHTNLTL